MEELGKIGGMDGILEEISDDDDDPEAYLDDIPDDDEWTCSRISENYNVLTPLITSSWNVKTWFCKFKCDSLIMNINHVSVDLI